MKLAELTFPLFIILLTYLYAKKVHGVFTAAVIKMKQTREIISSKNS